jgi:hypothetical protein
MRKIISNLYIILLVLTGCLSIHEENSAGTTATGNNGTIVGDIEQNTYLKRLLADGEISSEDVVVHLYSKDDPYTVKKSTQLNNDNQFRFEQLVPDTYTVRVDVGEEKGGLKENIVIANSDVVYITIEINIYVTNIINNFYFEGEKTDVKNLVSSYGSTQLMTNLDGSFTIKTLGGTNETLVLVTQSSDSLEIDIRAEEGVVVVTPISEELEVAHSVQVSSSSSEDIMSSSLASSSSVLEISSVVVASSSSDPILSSENTIKTLDTITLRLDDSNSWDTWTTSVSGGVNLNSGSEDQVRIGQYDYATNHRFLIKFEIPLDLVNSKIIASELEITVCAWWHKNPGVKNSTYNSHRMIRSWSEGSGKDRDRGETNSPIIDGATFNDFKWGEAWNSPGIGLDGVDASETKYHEDTFNWDVNGDANIGEKRSFTITNLLRDWLENGYDNNGILIRRVDENNSELDNPDLPIYCSSEADKFEDKPLLKVIYEK